MVKYQIYGKLYNQYIQAIDDNLVMVSYDMKIFQSDTIKTDKSFGNAKFPIYENFSTNISKRI